MQNPLSDSLSTAAIIVAVAAVLIVLGVAVPALTYRKKQPPEKFPQFVRRVFLRRRQ